MISVVKSCVAEVGFELATLVSAVRRALDCAMESDMTGRFKGAI